MELTLTEEVATERVEGVWEEQKAAEDDEGNKRPAWGVDRGGGRPLKQMEGRFRGGRPQGAEDRYDPLTDL
jgi:hypothetical protein